MQTDFEIWKDLLLIALGPACEKAGDQYVGLWEVAVSLGYDFDDGSLSRAVAIFMDEDLIHVGKELPGVPSLTMVKLTGAGFRESERLRQALHATHYPRAAKAGTADAKPVMVRFKKNYPPHNAGAQAAFPPEKAAYFVRAGIARYADWKLTMRTAWQRLRHPHVAFRNWYMANSYFSPPDDPEPVYLYSRRGLPIRIERVTRWLGKHWPTFVRDVLVGVTAIVLGGLILWLLHLN